MIKGASLMDKITITGVLEELTRKGDDPASRINFFNRVRDIEYLICPGSYLREADLLGVLRQNCGSCLPKHYLLGEMFRLSGYDVRYHTYSFRWEASALPLPEEIGACAGKLPLTYHVACSALIDGRWTLLDATWNMPLKTLGFPVNEKWDGSSDTALAVTPVEGFISPDIMAHSKLYQCKMRSYLFGEKVNLARFTNMLNKWLVSSRGPSKSQSGKRENVR